MSDARFLSTDDLVGLAAPAEFIEVVREAYRQVGEGAPAEPRTTLTTADPPGKFTGYLAVLPETGAMGGYTYSVGFGSRDTYFVTPLFDAETGEPLAVLDGAWFNPFKTGAVGAVGLDTLARPGAAELALIGTGRQARGQLRAAATVREWETIRVYSPTASHRNSFAREFDSAFDATVEAVDTPSDAVRTADAVITATTATEPVFDGADLTAGTHVTAVGQYHPAKRELDDETVSRSTYVPDLRARVERDAGAYLHAVQSGAIEPDHLHAELGEVVAGARPGRTDPEEITVFDSGGTAIETVAAAQLLFERALAEDRGTTIEFTPASEAMPGGW